MLGHGGPLPGPEPEQDLASPRRYQPIVLPRDEAVRERGRIDRLACPRCQSKVEAGLPREVLRAVAIGIARAAENWRLERKLRQAIADVEST